MILGHYMKGCFLFVHLLLFSTFSLSAQDSLRIYFNKNESYVPAKYASHFMDLVKLNDSSGLYKGMDYYMTGSIRSAGLYFKDKGEFLKTGKFLFYHPNGKKSEEGLFVIDTNQVSSVRTGKWKYYYPDGRPLEEKIFLISNDFLTVHNLTMSYWDTAGNQTVAKGNGSYQYRKEMVFDSIIQAALFTGKVKEGKYDGPWTGQFNNGKIACQYYYQEGQLLAGKIYNSKGVVLLFDTLNSPAFYEGGEAELIRIYQAIIKYPQLEMDNDIQGAVVVNFLVDEDGRLSGFTVVNSVSPGLDKEALRAVSQFPRFRPKMVNGKRVKSEYTQEITFKLV